MKASFENLFLEIGLGTNEAKAYWTLLQHGELSVTELATQTKIHRRNVYDVLNRLVEKGLVSSVVQAKNSLFRAVDPAKLRELLHEQEYQVQEILPKLRRLKEQESERQQAFLYQNVDGYKNYLRDILRVGANVDVLGAKSAWLDPRIRDFLPWFAGEIIKRKLKFRFLFDSEMKHLDDAILCPVPGKFKFFPPAYSTKSCIDVFGNHVVISAPQAPQELGRSFATTVVIDQRLASSFRTWFELMWQHSEER